MMGLNTSHSNEVIYSFLDWLCEVFCESERLTNWNGTQSISVSAKAQLSLIWEHVLTQTYVVVLLDFTDWSLFWGRSKHNTWGVKQP